MIRAVTDLREGPESRVQYEYRKVGKRRGRLVSNRRVAVHSGMRGWKDDWLWAALVNEVVWPMMKGRQL